MTDIYPKLYEKIRNELNFDVQFSVATLSEKYEMETDSILPYIAKICEENPEDFSFNEKKGNIMNIKLLDEATQMIDEFGEKFIKVALSMSLGNQDFSEVKKLRNEFSEKLDKGLMNAILYVVTNSSQYESSYGLMVSYITAKAIDLRLNEPFSRSILLTLDINSQANNPAIRNQGLLDFISNIDHYVLGFLDNYGYQVGLAKNIKFLSEFHQKLALFKKFPGWNLIKHFPKKYEDIITFAQKTLTELGLPAVSLMKVKPGYRVVSTFGTFGSVMDSITWASLPPLLEMSGGEWITIDTVRAVFDKTIVLKEPRIGMSRVRTITNSTVHETTYTLSLVMLKEFVESQFGISKTQIRRWIPVKQILDRFGVEMGIKLGWFDDGILPCFYPDLIYYLIDDRLVFARFYQGGDKLPFEEADRSNKELIEELEKTGEYEFGGDRCLDFYITREGEKHRVGCISLIKYKNIMTGFISRKPEESEPIKEANERFMKLLSKSF